MFISTFNITFLSKFCRNVNADPAKEKAASESLLQIQYFTFYNSKDIM